jgi:uncharacterized phage protein (predicted DNA packaging)
MLTLTETKLHLRVSHNDEDTLIGAMMQAATYASADYLNIDVDQLTSTVPSPIKAATLLMVGDLYENRESQSDRPFNRNPTYRLLLDPYRTVEL